jgi:hypothetical protein
MVLTLTQPLTETNTKNLHGGKERPARKTDNLPPSVRRLFTKGGILDVSEPYRSPRSVIVIALLFYIHSYWEINKGS